MGYSETAKSQIGLGNSNRTEDQTGSINWQMTDCDPEVSRCLSPLVGTAGSCFNPVLASSPLTPQRNSRRKDGGGSGRLTFLLSSGRLVPWVENTTFSLQFRGPLSLREAPPHCTRLCLCDRARASQPALGSAASCPAGNPSSKTRRTDKWPRGFSTIDFRERQDNSCLERQSLFYQ